MRSIALLALPLVFAAPATAGAVTISFEAQGAGAPQLFNFNAGAPLAIDGVTFTGGTVLNNEFSSPDLTAVYATAPFGSGYANPISIDLGGAFSFVSLDLVNMSAGTYTLASNTGLSETVTVDGGIILPLSLTGSGITSLTMTAVTTTGAGPAYDFAIDNLSAFGPAAAAVPEPATWALMIGGFGLVGTGLRRSRRALARA